MNISSKLEIFSLYILYMMVLISPLVSIYAGLSIAVFFILVALTPTIIAFKNNSWSGVFDLPTYKISLLILMYSLFSVFWAIDRGESFSLLCRVFIMFIAFIALFDFLKRLDDIKKNRICFLLTLGFIIAIIAANVEIVTDGFVTKFFRSFEKKEHIFHLTDLNRGSSYLSLIFWPVFAYFLLSKRWLCAALIFTITFLTIFRLESQSSSLAIFLGSLSLLFVFNTGRVGITLIMILTCVCVFSVAFIANIMDPAEVYKIIPKISNSASEIRLYIWDFSASVAAKKPFLGWGFNASRAIAVDESQYVLNGRHPLPLHPHNNILQIWLELGIVGLCLYTAFILSIMNNLRKNFQVKENKLVICTAFGLLITCFSIGQTGYGIWQFWWLSSIMLSSCLMRANINFSKEEI